MKKQHIPYIIIAILLLLLWLAHGCGNRDAEYWKDQAARKDTLLIEADGQYSKMVQHAKNQRQINKATKSNLGNAYNTIKENKERILNYQQMVATFASRQSDTVLIAADSSDSTMHRFTVWYPDRASSFIQYDGTIRWQSKELAGLWTFDTLNLSMVLTEQKDKSWRTRVVGPEFFRVNSIEVVSLPPEKYDPPHLFRPVIGGGAGRNLNTEQYNVHIEGGVDIRDRFLLLGTASSDGSIRITAAKIFK